jgi:hypothetical protein
MKRNINATTMPNKKSIHSTPVNSTNSTTTNNVQTNFETTRSTSISTSNSIAEARSTFLKRVSDGISHLVNRHGYSRSRASSLILGEIRNNEPLPDEDEIFDVMTKMGLGMNEASEVIVVSKALTKIRKERNLPPAQAIESLTSCLTTMKLLGKVETQFKCQLSPSSDSSASLTSPSPVPTPSPIPVLQTPNPVLKRRNSKSSKNTCKRRKEEDNNKSSSNSNSNTISTGDDIDNDIDVEVAQKVILQKAVDAVSDTANTNTNVDRDHVHPSSPSQTNNTRIKTPSPKVSREKRDLESITQGQPNTKRPRLDSI